MPRMALLLAALVSVLTCGARGRAQDLTVLPPAESAPGFDHARLIQALRLYLEQPDLDVRSPSPSSDDSMEAQARREAASGSGRISIYWTWTDEFEHLDTHILYRSGDRWESMQVTVEYPQEVSPDFYRQLALKVKSLILVARFGRQEDAQSHPRASAEPRSDPAADRASNRLQLSLSLHGSVALQRDAMSLQPDVGVGAVLEHGPFWAEALAARSIADERQSAEGQAEITLSRLVLRAGLRFAGEDRSAPLYVDGGMGAGVLLVEAQGRLSGVTEERSERRLSPIVAASMALGIRLLSRAHLLLTASVDTFVIRREFRLRQHLIYSTRRLLPRIEISLRFPL